MFTIYAKTFNGYTTEISFLEKELALDAFNRMLSVTDMASIDMIDGLTGEVIFGYANGKFNVLDGYIL